MISNPHSACLVCQHTDQQSPLIQFRYQGAEHWICSAHLPILIHHPEELAEVLPGALDLPPADHHDHD